MPARGEAPLVRLLGDWRDGRYAAVEVVAAGPQTHVLAGDGVMAVRWPGAKRAVLPVLVYPGAGPAEAARLTLDGRTVTLDLGGGEAADPFPWAADAGTAAVGVIDPRAYAATAGWRPGRPTRERATFAAAALLFACAVAATLGLVRRPKRRLLGSRRWPSSPRPAFGVGSGAADVGVAAVPAPRGRGRRSLDFRRLPPSAASPQTLRVAFVGETRPIAFSPAHLRTLSPVLTCDAAGRPEELSMTLPPGVQAAVVQRVASGEGQTPPPWARPLVRSVYAVGRQ